MNTSALLEILRTTLKFHVLGNLGIKDILYDPATMTVSLSGGKI